MDCPLRLCPVPLRFRGFGELLNEYKLMGPRGGVVTQRIANPWTPVQFRPWPPSVSRLVTTGLTLETLKKIDLTPLIVDADTFCHAGRFPGLARAHSAVAQW